jgi:AraC family transcriptional regulator, regulatory protein of adaptative response / methylated-DNA-[protein]-cysteine methyltransferase
MISMNTSAQLALPMILMPPITHHEAGNAESWEDAAWRQLAERGKSPEKDTEFFYGVTTTGVFCRPGCSSRAPLRRNVRFFRTAEEAQTAGFRACKRCRPTAARSNSLSRIRGYIERNADRPVRLKELGRVAQMSPFTVQRLFKREMGVSPLQYQRALRAGALRASLKEGSSVTTAIYDAGFNSASRAYEGAPLGMTPQRFAQGGRGERIGYTAARTPFGWMIVGATERGLCWLSLAGSKTEAEAALRAEFPEAVLRRDAALARWIEEALAMVREGDDLVHYQAGARGTGTASSRSETKIGTAPSRSETRLDLRGTVFQLRVWQALRQIPRGQTRSYSQLAREIGDPKATRAVARACAVNRVALLVPCHRVIGADGSLTGYRWGQGRKRSLLAAERA